MHPTRYMVKSTSQKLIGFPCIAITIRFRDTKHMGNSLVWMQKMFYWWTTSCERTLHKRKQVAVEENNHKLQWILRHPKLLTRTEIKVVAETNCKSCQWKIEATTTKQHVTELLQNSIPPNTIPRKARASVNGNLNIVVQNSLHPNIREYCNGQVPITMHPLAMDLHCIRLFRHYQVMEGIFHHPCSQTSQRKKPASPTFVAMYPGSLWLTC